MRQNKFPHVLLLTPEEGLALEIQMALKAFGLRKLIVVGSADELQRQVKEHAFNLVLVDTDGFESIARAELVKTIHSLKERTPPLIVALARVESKSALLELKAQNFATIIIKPVSIAIVEQALSELIERERNQPIDRQALERVHELFLKGATFEAERTLSIWLEKESESLEGLTLLSLQQLKKQEFHRASATINKVLKIQPDYLPALQLRSRISLRLGHLEEAFRSLEKEEKYIAALEAKRVRGPLHTVSESENAALSFCETFRTREGMTALLNNLALQLSRTGRAGEALALYKKALGPLEDQSSQFVSLFNRGRLHLKIKKFKEALQDFTWARELSPEELYPKIDELIAQCRAPQPNLVQEPFLNLERGAAARETSHLPDDAPPSRPERLEFIKFNKDNILEMVFLGKLNEASVPPDSIADWLQMKKKLMYVLFLNDLPSQVKMPPPPAESPQTTP